MLQKVINIIFVALLFLQGSAFGDGSESIQAAVETPFKAFTGKVIRNKVRLRLNPTLEGKIVREMNKDDMVIVIGETEDFYSVKAPDDIKAYVFRTFILDNVVEGKHVNVRLEPDLDAPVIGQLNQGETIQGNISPLNSKWYEIPPPENTKFFVCKEYIEKIGDPSLKAAIQKRRDEVNALLDNSYQLSQDELRKPFQEIKLDGAMAGFSKVINHYAEFPAQVSRAKELLTSVQEAYLQKKLNYLESKAQQQSPSPTVVEEKTSASNYQMPMPSNPRLAAWVPAEEIVYQRWAEANNQASMQDFYNLQKKEAVIIKGVVESYIRNVRNKPGDYILISTASRLPSAYLYSTQIDLQNSIGKEVTLLVVPRPNNNFAHPAYYVLTVE